MIKFSYNKFIRSALKLHFDLFFGAAPHSDPSIIYLHFNSMRWPRGTL
jgi:hypothetical protein